MPEIIRLKGDAPRLLWPARTLAPLLTDLVYVRSELARDPRSSSALARSVTLGTQATDAFAHVNNLRRRQASSWPWRLLGQPPSFWRDHADVFQHCQLLAPFGGGRTRLVIVHTYLPIPLEIVPDDFIVDALPASWHRDISCTAYALRSAALAPTITGTTQENDSEAQ